MVRSGTMTRGSSGCSVMCMSTTCVGLSASNGSRAREQLIEDDADRVEVRARVERIAAALLGLMYSGVPHTMPGLVMSRRHGLDAHLREAEVHDLDEVAAGADLLEDDVLGLEIAMDDAEVMRFRERGEHLPKEADDATERERPFSYWIAREVLAAQELHDEIELAVLGLAEVDDADRVRVIEAARGARLGDEARRRVLLTDEMRVDDLDGDGAPQLRLLGAIHAAHPADADEIENDVAARGASDRRADRRSCGDFPDGKAARRTELVRLLARALALRTLPHSHDGPTVTAKLSRRKPADDA